MIAKIAKYLGWKTWYHVVYTFPHPSGGVATVDLCVSLRPWIRQGETFTELRDYLFNDAKKNGALKPPSILSITRIGR